MADNSDKADVWGGIVLGIAALAALVIANSPVAAQYNALIHATAEIRVGSFALSKGLDHWVNDGLMAIFFLLVGLEIKREVMEGSLAGVQKAALPAVAAIGGFFVPALLYGVLTWGDAEVPTTDTAVCEILPRRLACLARLGRPDGHRYRFRHRDLRIARPCRSGIP